MLPTMIFEPEHAGLCRNQQRLGQAAGLVELDVHRVVALGDRSERGAVMHQLVGTDRNGPGDARQEIVVAGGEGLLDQLARLPPRRRQEAIPCSGCHASLASTMSLACGTACAHGDEPLFVAIAAELELEQGMRQRRLARLRRHRLGRSEREGEGGEHGVQRADPGKRRGALGPTAWPRDPTGRNRAHCARRPQAAASRARPGSTRRRWPGAGLDGGDHALDALAIARIGHAFAAPRMGAVADRRDHHDGLVL